MRQQEVEQKHVQWQFDNLPRYEQELVFRDKIYYVPYAESYTLNDFNNRKNKTEYPKFQQSIQFGYIERFGFDRLYMTLEIKSQTEDPIKHKGTSRIQKLLVGNRQLNVCKESGKHTHSNVLQNVHGMLDIEEDINADYLVQFVYDHENFKY